jgi:hypothetical protein
MNRKERRSVEKKLKLTEFYSKQTFAEKMKRIAGNIENGKKKQEDFHNEANAWLQEQRNEKNSNVVESKAEFIARTRSIPYMDALREAQEQQ